MCNTIHDPDNEKNIIYLTNIIKEYYFSENIKSLTIQSSMIKYLIGKDEWLNFFWNNFYEKANHETKQGEIKYIYNHEAYWYINFFFLIFLINFKLGIMA